ncbi:neutral permease protein [Diaporthe amygdali]|uniref:neutral permease protein n=1 Tax=Phomopsis amygdali TaxID=1214568 RepID=UPI0022FF2C52|nr:neutral permease protein [Diaporthe amygdali]KAJ0122476.1 neutral permease protein [Diaporthe amygdali]
MSEIREQQQFSQDQKPKDGQPAIKELWDQAAADFETICGKSLRQGRVKTFDDVKRIIEKDRSTTSHDAVQQDGWEKAKSVGLKTLKCLKLLANVAAQGASLIPLPPIAANTATSALGFVFDIPQAIKAYNDAVNQVFEEISSALAQMRIYESMEKVDGSLLYQIHLVMVSIVRLSAHVVKYQQGGKRERGLQKLKSIFNNDSGLNDEMGVFKRVLQYQRDVESTVTLAVVVETRQDIVLLIEKNSMLQTTVESTQRGVQSIQIASESMQQDLQSIRSNADRNDQLTKIKETLELPSVDTSTDTRTRFSEGCYEGTGSWIWTHETYDQWTAPKERNSGSRVLFISGPPGSGKSSACALIARRLEDQQDRTYVAHYFFPKKQESKKQDSDSRKPDSDTKQAADPIRLALKSMAHQIAKVDTIVRNALYNASQDPSAIRRASELNVLWERLKIEATGSRATYYLVFDGLENLVSSDAESLIKFVLGLQRSEDSKSESNLRFLVSGKQDMFENSNTRTALQIRMEEENQPDMRIFISRKLKEQDILQHPKPESDQHMVREMILQRLPRNAKGSYTSLELGLDDIIHRLRTRVTIKELERKLDQPIISHEAAIETLQRSLSGDDVNELNELLKWVYPFADTIDPLSLQQLEQAKFLSSGTESLVSLQNTIKNKYSKVLKIENGNVHVQDLALDFLKKADITSAASQEPEDSATISMTITINNVDRETCGNFLWDLAHKANRQKFNFDFEAHQVGNSTARIAVDELDAYHTIVLRTFQYLNEEPNERTSDIGIHLAAFLPDHLAGIRHLQEDENQFLRPQQYQEIGQNLYTLFKDGTIFERHRANFERIFWNVQDLKEIRDWLTDTSVMRGVQDKSWRNQVKNTISPANGYLRYFARPLLKDADDEAVSMSHQGDSDEKGKSSSSSSYYDNIDWTLISEWCRNFLNLSDADLDSLWYERLASTALHHDDKVTKARELFQLALEKEKPSWLCHRGLGTTYDHEEKFAEAMECFELSIAEAKKDGAVPKPELTDLFEMHLLTGRCALNIGDLKKAAEFYLQASSSKDVDQAMKAQLGHMKALMRSPDPQYATKWLQDKLSEETEGRRLCDILKMAAREDDHGDFIPKMFTLASDKPDTLKGVVRAMETATARPGPGAESDEVNPLLDDEVVGVLKYYRALAMYTYRHKVASETVDPTREALRLWEECCDQLSNIGSGNANFIRKKAKVKIAQHYFEDMLARDRLDDVDKLAQLARSENQVQGEWEWEASGFLSALYAHHGNTTQSRAALVRKARFGLEVLSDETPQNDNLGFYLLWQALVQNGDFTNAVIALLFCISPDVLADALNSESKDVQDDKGLDNQRLLDTVRKLAGKTLEVVRSQLPEISPQHQRLSIAREHIDTCLGAISSSNDALEGGEGQSRLALHDSETVAAYHMIQDRLRAAQQDITEVSDWTWSCDGRTMDGKECTKREVYHCIYCTDIDFCNDCLGRLRDPERCSDIESTVCSSKHRWLKLPLPSSGLYVGPQATSLRSPKVQQRHEDHQILEVSGDGDATVNVEEWKADVARAWNIVLEGGGSGAD